MFDFIMSVIKLVWIIAIIVFIIKITPSIKKIIEGVRQGTKDAQQTNALRQKRMAQNNETIEEMNKDLETLKQSFKCPSCGAALTINSDSIGSFCTFCGAPIQNSQELVKLSLEYKSKLAERDVQLQKIQHEESKDKRQLTKQMSTVIFQVIFVVLAFIFLFVILLRH